MAIFNDMVKNESLFLMNKKSRLCWGRDSCAFLDLSHSHPALFVKKEVKKIAGIICVLFLQLDEFRSKKKASEFSSEAFRYTFIRTRHLSSPFRRNKNNNRKNRTG
jgi:hypothetical protein